MKCKNSSNTFLFILQKKFRQRDRLSFLFHNNLIYFSSSFRKARSIVFVLLFSLLFISSSALKSQGETETFEFGNTPIKESELIHTPPPLPEWLVIGAPFGLLAFFFLLVLIVFKMIPYRETKLHFNLHDLPVAAQRGIGMAVILFGISFGFGGFEVYYQINLHGSAEAYFGEMGLGKLIAITHAHLVGFTTSFFLIGIPFSLHFNRLRVYQYIFPLGLAASLTDVASWWGMKFISPNFEYITWWCGAVFGISYIWMLIGLVRIIFFPSIHWFPDFINDETLQDKLKTEDSN